MELTKVLEPIVDDMAAVEKVLAGVSARILASGDGSNGDGAGRDGGGSSRGARERSGILEQIARHPFAVPGKRLRPALVLLSSLAGGRRSGAAAVGLAAAVEVLHSASLVHDDIIDGADERRHQVSLNKRYGNRIAVLAGDILYTEFFSLITELAVDEGLRSRLLELFLGTTRKMCIGEILAQEARAKFEGAGSPDRAARSHARTDRGLGFEEYLEISEDKTASLFSSCCEGGALLGGSSREGVRALRDFGLLFGLTFQMLDDLADGDHGLDPRVDLRARTEEYADRTKAAAAAFEESSAGVSSLLDYVLAHALSA